MKAALFLSCFISLGEPPVGVTCDERAAIVDRLVLG